MRLHNEKIEIGNTWLDTYLKDLPASESYASSALLSTFGIHASPDSDKPKYWFASEWLEEDTTNSSAKYIAQLLLKQHQITFEGIRVNLEADAPFWAWGKWSTALLEMLHQHPQCNNSKAQKSLVIMHQLSDKININKTTLTHGDIHPNNWMFKGKDCILIDWGEMAVAPAE